MALLAWGLGACLGAAAQSPAPGARTPAAPSRSAAGPVDTLPAVNLWIDLRQVDEVVREETGGGRTSTVVGTQGGAGPDGAVWRTARSGDGDHPPFLAQLRVRNGGQAQASWRRLQPVEWVSAAWAPGVVGGGGGRPAPSAAGLSREWHGVPAGQEIVVSARWPGGAAPVTVELAVDAESPETAPAAGALPPANAQTRTAASVFAPLDQWLTVARSSPTEPGGGLSRAGIVGTQAPPPPAVLLQLRVRVAALQAPPMPPGLPPKR